MNPLPCVAIFLLCRVSVADSEPVELRTHRRDPCEHNTAVFTTTSNPSEETRHEVQLGSTYRLFIFGKFCIPRWTAEVYLTDVSPECDFFSNQDYLLEDIRDSDVLRELSVTLVYSLETATKVYAFRLYLDGILFSVYTRGVIKRVKHPPARLKKEVIEAANEFVTGRHGSMLESERYAKRWQTVCEIIRRRRSAFDEYKIWLNAREDRVFCSLQSTIPWSRVLTFGLPETRVDWTFLNHRFMTVGNVPRRRRDDFACVIVSPDGTVGTQRLSLGPIAIRPPPTPVPTKKVATTRAEPRPIPDPLVPTTRIEAAPYPSTTQSPSLGIELVTEMERVTYTHGSGKVRASGNVSVTVASAVVISAFVLGVVVSLVVFKDRVRRLATGFRPVSARSD